MKGFLGSALGLAVVAAIGFAGFRPNGPGQAYVGRWLKGRAIESRWTWLTTTGGRVGNRSDSALILVEFGDYQCPWCREAQKAVDSLLREYPNVAFVYHPFPLSIHPHAQAAALASICAERQGAFEALHQFLYADAGWEKTDSPVWNMIAIKTGVSDTAAFTACLGQHERAAQLDTSVEIGRELGVVGTPTFLSRDGFLDRQPSVESFKSLLGLAAPR